MTNTLYERAKEIGESIGMNKDKAEKWKKSTWQREVKTKIKEKIQQRLTNDFCRKEEDTTKHVLDCEVELEKGKHTIGSSNKPLETDTKDI